MLAGNEGISWYPPHIKEGRFGNWLENNIDWALCRERYWGTPLPVWINDEDPEERHLHRQLRRARRTRRQDRSRTRTAPTSTSSPSRRPAATARCAASPR